MIIDSLENAEKYFSVHKSFVKAFEYLKGQDLNALEVGKTVIEEGSLTSAVSAKEGVAVADAKFEAHNNFIDIQVCIAGKEKMGWSTRSAVKDPVAEYNAEKDVIFYKDEPGMYFELQPGQFAIFFPEDVHAPMIGEGVIKKLVVKVKI
ncbi:YhcH/YjgK/YiaL family protein [Arcticibacter sp. MXS-1]|uniref:YhcH/YjgK/YiaL family protein n=1 Tax=Arcticibacter sp. MXS-1 TaxID=3341726 RepID=UPI0035A90711